MFKMNFEYKKKISEIQARAEEKKTFNSLIYLFVFSSILFIYLGNLCKKNWSVLFCLSHVLGFSFVLLLMVFLNCYCLQFIIIVSMYRCVSVC